MGFKTVHIISFDIPYPPHYGGVIDVFYKVKELHRAGWNIILHCFEYAGRGRASELSQYAAEVYYYPRILGFRPALNMKPYILNGRRSEKLMSRLLQDSCPVIFEGFHSCYYLADSRLKNRLKIYRESNIEHHYYFSLFKSERSPFRKAYFLAEALKLKFYQPVLRYADIMLAVSEQDTRYLKNRFPKNTVIHLPSFHANNGVETLEGLGKYALYHGNIAVPENALAAEFLITKVFNQINYPLIIAGMNPPERIKKRAEGSRNIQLIPNPSEEEMLRLIREAHIHILVTFQATGLKLKLLNTLYKGRHCIVNEPMLAGTRLHSLCHIANSPQKIIEKIEALAHLEFLPEEVKKRREVLESHYSNQANLARLISLLGE